MRHIVVLGDSLGMPREETPIKETYPYLLNQYLKEDIVFTRHKRANTTEAQCQASAIQDDLALLCPDIVVIHLGIVDCAPRLFTKRQRWVLAHMGLVGKVIIRLLAKHRYILTRLLRKVYVSKRAFTCAMERIITSVPEMAKVYVIGILPTSQVNLRKSYGYQENILGYNAVLQQLCSKYKADFINVNDWSADEVLLEDGIHLNIDGHQRLASKLFDMIGA